MNFAQKNTATSMAGGAGRTGAGRWRPSPKKKICYYFWVFSHFHFVECFSGTRQRLCRVPDKKHSAKASLPINFLPSAALGKAFAECISGFVECRRHSAKRGCPVVAVAICLLQRLWLAGSSTCWLGQPGAVRLRGWQAVPTHCCVLSSASSRGSAGVVRF